MVIFIIDYQAAGFNKLLDLHSNMVIFIILYPIPCFIAPTDLHSNMVIFIINCLSSSFNTLYLFTFQYGYIYYL